MTPKHKWFHLLHLWRLWYAIITTIIHILLIYANTEKTLYYERVQWQTNPPYIIPKIELFLQKLFLLISTLVLIAFVYPGLFAVNNNANDGVKLTINGLIKTISSKTKLLTDNSSISLAFILWKHCFSISGTLHLLMSWSILFSSIPIEAKQILIGFREPGNAWLTDFDYFFNLDNSLPAIKTTKRFQNNSDFLSIQYPNINDRHHYHTGKFNEYSRLGLFHFIFATVLYCISYPTVFWSISKSFSILFSISLFLNALQWLLMYGSFQLIIRLVCYNQFNIVSSTSSYTFLLLNQPYMAIFLYLLLEFLVFISSVTIYFYGYSRFKQFVTRNYFPSKKIRRRHRSCWDKCSYYCPSLIAIVIILLFTACKIPLMHDILILYIQQRNRLLIITFINEIVHVLLTIGLWIFLTTKTDWHFFDNGNDNNHYDREKTKVTSPILSKNLILKSTPTKMASMPELSTTTTSDNDNRALINRPLSDVYHTEPYEKIRIFQSEIYYRNNPTDSLWNRYQETADDSYSKRLQQHSKPKNWSLPLNNSDLQYDNLSNNNNNKVVVSYEQPIDNEIQYRNAIRKTLGSIYKFANGTNDHEQQKFSRSYSANTPRQLKQNYTTAKLLRANNHNHHHPDLFSTRNFMHSEALLISQV
ncbi:unnamed protein product [Didymodactylos carnosus]|uniref:Uncharacterized protein n=1 Tax=Didymodactylos carnosus TaxID=1234261 RepID=A0A814TGP2_9BILA|nr:unnamed protein product [Didymodactylos carnosus]CAF3925087.1 unnamed protein product [Didymodactylos carnosus]